MKRVKTILYLPFIWILLLSGINQTFAHAGEKNSVRISSRKYCHQENAEVQNSIVKPYSFGIEKRIELEAADIEEEDKILLKNKLAGNSFSPSFCSDIAAIFISNIRTSFIDRYFTYPTSYRYLVLQVFRI